MLKVLCFLLSLFILLSSTACDLQKQDERVSSLEAEVKQLKADVATLKQKQSQKVAPEHRYELHKEGLRTWRFDPATGETCIQLTSDADWKSKEAQARSCDCIDSTQHWNEMPIDTEQQQKDANNYFKFVEMFCGR